MRQTGVEGLEHGAVRSDDSLVLALGVARDAQEVGAVRFDAGRFIGTRGAGAAFDDALALTTDAVGQVAAALALERAVGAATARVTDLRPAGGGEGEGHDGDCEKGAVQSDGTIHHLPRSVVWLGSGSRGAARDASSARPGQRFCAKVTAYVSSELEDILVAFSRLVEEHEASRGADPEGEDPENFRCEDCVDCVSCRFCTACERCTNCTYCDACSDSADCTQSRECVACADCSQSNLSGYCEKSSYLTLCLDCDNCVQCFGCVGLSGAEFHILNQPFKRGAFFKKVAELRKLLDVKLTQGWVPPWVEEASEDEEPEDEEPEDEEPEEEEPEEEEPEEEEPEEDDLEEEEPEEDEPEEDEPEEDEPEEDDLEDEPVERVVEHARAPRAAMEATAPVVVRTGPAQDRSTEVATSPTRRRVDPYTDHTSVLPEVSAPKEHTGSWPPADAEVARSMDRGTRSSDGWEELFEPDELPPPRARVVEESPATTPVSDAPSATKRGRFDRLLAPAGSSEPASSASVPAEAEVKRAGTPSSLSGQRAQPEPPDPESTGSIRRAKRPRRE